MDFFGDFSMKMKMEPTPEKNSESEFIMARRIESHWNVSVRNGGKP